MRRLAEVGVEVFERDGEAACEGRDNAIRSSDAVGRLSEGGETQHQAEREHIGCGRGFARRDAFRGDPPYEPTTRPADVTRVASAAAAQTVWVVRRDERSSDAGDHHFRPGSRAGRAEFRRAPVPARRRERRHRAGACGRVHPRRTQLAGHLDGPIRPDRTPSVPGHELSGVIAELGYGTTGLSIGQRVFGFADWTRDGSLAEFTAVEARNLAPLPADIDHTVGAALPISGLTAWQALFEHARLQPGQTVLIHGAGGGVGSVAVQLARMPGRGSSAPAAAQIGNSCSAWALKRSSTWPRISCDGRRRGDVVFDVLGGEILERSAALVRAGGTLVTIAGPPNVTVPNGRAIFFVVEPDRAQLIDLARRAAASRLRPVISAVCRLAEAPVAPPCPPAAAAGRLSRSGTSRQRRSSGFAAIRPAIPLRTAAAAVLPGLRRACSSKQARNSAARLRRG